MRYPAIHLLVLVALSCTVVLAADDAKPDKNAKKEPAVSIKNMQFTPATLTIKVGQSVTWTNADDRDHTVVSADGGKTFKSENLSTKGTFTYKFEKKGKYAYTCSYHPRMKGTIVVEE